MCDVKLANVYFSYPNQPVLDNVSLEITSGDYVAVLGPNGAGKSTLLNLIVGLVQPNSGRILIDNQTVDNARELGLLGYVPQSYNKNLAGFPAKVEEVVALGRLSGTHRSHHSAAVGDIEAVLKMVGMEKMRGRRIGDLSGGQQQRMILARAVAANPRVLVLDEPTSGIDYDARAEILELLANLNRSLGMTVIMVSHDLDRITEYASKVACIDRSLCFYGSSHEYRHSHFQSRHM